MVTVFPRPILPCLDHTLPGCDQTGLESSTTSFTRNSMPLMPLSPSCFYTDEPEPEVLVPPRELSGPDNELNGRTSLQIMSQGPRKKTRLKKR